MIVASDEPIDLQLLSFVHLFSVKYLVTCINCCHSE